MKLIVGLGNPGLKYKNTRHNIGFLAIDNFTQGNKNRLNKDVVLLKPQGYMNNSGPALKKVLNRLNLPLENVLVVCDDINLELGIIRLRARGSSGGHKGLQSIIDELGTQEINRLRIGIGVEKGKVLKDYVLSKFRTAEKKVLKEVIDRTGEAIGVWIEDGIETAMNRYNAKNMIIKER